MTGDPTRANLEETTVASPCPVKWNDMTGDDQTRYCQQCQLHVYNLSSLSREEAETLITQKEGKLCIKLFTRADGTVLTADCPVGVQLLEKIRRGIMWIIASIAAILTLPALVNWLMQYGGQTSGLYSRKTPKQNTDAVVMLSARPTDDLELPTETDKPYYRTGEHSE